MTTNTTTKTITDYNKGIEALQAGKAQYVPCQISDIPSNAIFCGGRNNDIIEVEYACIGASPASRGDAWMRRRDRSVTIAWTYYRLVAK